MTRRKKPIGTRHTRRVLDRHGRAALMVTAKAFRDHSGSILRLTNKSGAVAISKAGKPIAVALAPDQFVNLCVAYAIAALRRNK